VDETTFALPGGVQEIALGVVMILVLMFRPAGIMGNCDLSLPARAASDPQGPTTSKA
jgi:branched-chain amino acid transport system permease protein